MPTYEIVNVQSLVRDWESTKGGPMKSYRIDLKDEAGESKSSVEWARKATSPPPTVGEKLDGTIEHTDFGLKIKVSPSGGFGGGGPRPRDPKESRRIAIQHGQKCAVDILRLAHDVGAWEHPSTVGEVVAQVKVIAAGLLVQVEEVGA